MNIVKHFIKIAGYYVKRLFCKHTESRVAACPYTGYTYTTCIDCGTRLLTIKENDGQA